MNLIRYATVVMLAVSGVSGALAQEPPAPKPKLKDEMRMPWKRGDENFIRLWLVAGPFPGDLQTDCLSSQGGEAGLQPTDGQEQKRADGTTVKWHSQTTWSDVGRIRDWQVPKTASSPTRSRRFTRPTPGRPCSRWAATMASGCG